MSMIWLKRAYFCIGLIRKSIVSTISPNLSHVNIGFGKDISIRELGLKISNIIGFKGRLKFDLSKPDGTPQKLLDTSLMQKWAGNLK